MNSFSAKVYPQSSNTSHEAKNKSECLKRREIMKRTGMVGIYFTLVLAFAGMDAWGCSSTCNCTFQTQAYYGPIGEDLVEPNPSYTSPQVGWRNRDVHGKKRDKCGLGWGCGPCVPKNDDELHKAPRLCKESYGSVMTDQSSSGKGYKFPATKKISGKTYELKKVEISQIWVNCESRAYSAVY